MSHALGSEGVITLEFLNILANSDMRVKFRSLHCNRILHSLPKRMKTRLSGFPPCRSRRKNYYSSSPNWVCSANDLNTESRIEREDLIYELVKDGLAGGFAVSIKHVPPLCPFLFLSSSPPPHLLSPKSPSYNFSLEKITSNDVETRFLISRNKISIFDVSHRDTVLLP